MSGGPPNPYGEPHGAPYAYGPPGPYGVPPYPYGVKPPARPGGVTAAGVLTIIAGSFGIAGALLAAGMVMLFGAFVGSIAESKSPGDPEAAAFVGWVFVVGLVVGLAAGGVALAHLMLGVRVLRGGPVARVVLTVWDGLVVAVLLVTAFLGLVEGDDPVGVVVWWLVSLPLPTAVVVCLWTPAASRWFDQRQDVSGRGRRAPDAPGPAR